MSFARPLDHEFALLPETALALGIAPHTTPTVSRRWVDLSTGGQASGVLWTGLSPRTVLLHREGSNARSLDELALRLGAPVAAIDIPGHGWSVGSSDRAAFGLAEAIALLAPAATALVGLGSGALTALAASALAPQLTTLVMVDAIPDQSAVGGAALWDRLATTASSILIRSRTSPVAPSDVDTLRRRSPNTRLLQLSVPAAGLETAHSAQLAAALQAVLPSDRGVPAIV